MDSSGKDSGRLVISSLFWPLLNLSDLLLWDSSDKGLSLCLASMSGFHQCFPNKLTVGEIKDILLWIFHEEEPGTCFITTLLFLDCSFFVSAFPHFPISNCLNLCFGTQGRSRRLKPFSHKQEMRNTERLLYPGGPHQVLLVSRLPVLLTNQLYKPEGSITHLQLWMPITSPGCYLYLVIMHDSHNFFLALD